MTIKEITINKSRTIEVDGVMGRTRYTKISVGMTADLNESDYPLGVEGEVKEHRDQLSKLVDEAMVAEIKKLKVKK